MKNCIFSTGCVDEICDKSCPRYAETSYLLERNGIDISNPVITKPPVAIDSVLDFLEYSQGQFTVYIVPKKLNTLEIALLFTYVAICVNWRGNQLHCSVYNLKYSQYIDALKSTWSTRSEPDELQYMRIWSESAKVLIISNIDFVNFNDFESQTFLSLIQIRQVKQLTTILISPEFQYIIGSDKSRFFPLFMNLLKSSKNNKGGKNQ